ncbi:chromosomal replication initiator protein DnaA [Candidatus Saccharibacteria bacterium]|nr:chromosomal replication initiator protein DnaA [Candidatus Saccharibacteria bacterium]MCB9834573.1 chromosomal replication initiator protein DnaA [Candidatus Nomurabacteria bacterium]
MEGQNNHNLSTIWRLCLGELQADLSSSQYIWLRNSELNQSDPSRYILVLNSSFAQKFAKDKLNNKIIAVLEKKLAQTGIKVSYQTSNNKPKSEPTPNQPQTQNPIQTKTNGLLDKYTFSNFVVGSSNNLAYAAALHVSQNPGERYNPLFIYGPPGVGKTHLLWAIKSSLKQAFPDIISHYITSEDFTNEFISAIKKGQKFTNKYRKADLLLVDDMQFIAGKDATQEEFFHTFNALYHANKQIVLTSDRPPGEIPTLEERLRSRFEGGMVADIQLPNYETREAIVSNTAKSSEVSLSQEVISVIAENVKSNIRDLEGAVKKIGAHQQLRNQLLTSQEVLGILGVNKNKKRLKPRQVLERVAEYFEVSVADILGQKRSREIAYPRQMAMYLFYYDFNMSYPQIATIIGNRDHTTILYGVKKIKKQLDQEQTEIKSDRDTLKELINN